MKSVQKKDFVVKCTILEVRDLKSASDAGITPYIKITCGRQVQQTDPIQLQNSVVWNQPFTFDSIRLNKYELETSQIKFEACARYSWSSDEVTGINSFIRHIKQMVDLMFMCRDRQGQGKNVVDQQTRWSTSQKLNLKMGCDDPWICQCEQVDLDDLQDEQHQDKAGMQSTSTEQNLMVDF